MLIIVPKKIVVDDVVDNVNYRSQGDIDRYIRLYGVAQTVVNITKQFLQLPVPTIEPKMVKDSQYMAFILVAQNELYQHYSLYKLWQNKEFVRTVADDAFKNRSVISYYDMYKSFAIKSKLPEIIPMKAVADAISGKRKILDATGRSFGVGLFLAKSIDRYHVVAPPGINRNLFTKLMPDDRMQFRAISRMTEKDFSEFDIILIDDFTEKYTKEALENLSNTINISKL